MDLHSAFSFSLNSRVQGTCVTTGKLEPNEKETLIAVSTANKIILKSSESSLHITDQIRCIAVAPFGDGYEVLIIGTESHIIAYDFYQNTTLFQKDVPDGINCLAIGNMGALENVIMCGGHCAIWGFDRTGKDVYWTVIGDTVTAMCLVDFDDDGQMELIVGSKDNEIRIFKNDLMRHDLMETDVIVCLTPIGGNRFAYALSNGTLGVYERANRLWRIKSKHVIASIAPFPTEEFLTCAWRSGKMDVRNMINGEVIAKEYLNGEIACAVRSKIQDNDIPEVTVVLVDGKVRGFDAGEKRIVVDEAQIRLREYGQKKHNLLMELSNYEHEESMSKEDKEMENRIPANTQLETMPRINYPKRCIDFCMHATNSACVKGVVIFAEGLFDGESHVTIPVDLKDSVIVPVVPLRDVAVDVHIKAFLGHPTSRVLHVFEVTRALPQFARFGILREDEKDEFEQPTCYTEFTVSIRMQRLVDWVLDHFIIPDSYPPINPEQTALTIRVWNRDSFNAQGCVEREMNKSLKFFILLTSTCSESSLHITDQIRCIAVAPFGDGYEVLIIGTESHIIAYDFYQNTTLFQKDVPDGINCLAIGNMGALENVIMCGGHCAIWGFDRTGKDVYWTVIGDTVTSMCLVDFDDDGQMELIVGSKDNEIRIFKNDLMRHDLMETDVIVCLTPIGGNRFAYALSNGTLGVYERANRLWRIKSKHVIASIAPFPTEEFLTCAWRSGKMDVRNMINGEVIAKEYLNGEIACAVRSKIQDNDIPEVTVVLVDGKVRGFDAGEKRIVVDEAQIRLREYGQKKHNLLMELSNYEHEESMSKEDKEMENRIPANTQLETMPRINYPKRCIDFCMHATNSACVKGVVIFAEGLFDGESHVTIPVDLKDSVIVPVVPLRDVAVDVHIKAFLGHPTSRVLHVFEVTRALPQFARFGILREDEKDEFEQPTCYTEFTVSIRMQRLVDWVLDHFIIPDSYPPINPEQTALTIRCLCLTPGKSGLSIQFDSSSNQLRITHDDIEACAAVTQSICDYCNIDRLESHGYFPDDFKTVADIIDEMDGLYEVKDRLTTELSEKQSMLKEIIVRAEDATNIDDMVLARKYYTRLKHVDNAVRQAFLLKTNNHERLVSSLRKLNKMIELASKLRIGEPSRAIIALCRDAIANDNLRIIPKIMEFGA